MMTLIQNNITLDSQSNMKDFKRYTPERSNCATLFQSSFYGLFHPESMKYFASLSKISSLFSNDIPSVFTNDTTNISKQSLNNSESNYESFEREDSNLDSNCIDLLVKDLALKILNNPHESNHYESSYQYYRITTMSNTYSNKQFAIQSSHLRDSNLNNGFNTLAMNQNAQNQFSNLQEYTNKNPILMPHMDRTHNEQFKQEEGTAPLNIENTNNIKQDNQVNSNYSRTAQGGSPYINPISPSSPKKSKQEEVKKIKKSSSVSKKILQTEKREAKKLMKRFGGENGMDSQNEEGDTKIPLVRVRQLHESEESNVNKNIDILKTLLRM